MKQAKERALKTINGMHGIAKKYREKGDTGHYYQYINEMWAMIHVVEDTFELPITFKDHKYIFEE